MSKPVPWHQIVRLKPELRSGELTLAEFAADLHEVVTEAGRRPIYEDPTKFFALTYPTHALRELVRDVAGRLAGQNNKAVRQLEMTYGGGKTHTLITLHHLFHDPGRLPDIAAVREFREHADAHLPRATTAALCFDKIDVEKGIEGVRAPDGERRTLRHPWSVLAFQLAGAEGLRMLHADNEDAERDTPPADPLLIKLIERQQRDGTATLILLDEVMMYAHAKARMAPEWVTHLQNFFQYLTQAVAKVDRAAIVASILATDPSRMTDELGKTVLREIAAILRRQREEGVQPVQKEDVAEVLRRRFFEPESIRDPQAYKSHVIGIVKGIAKLEETTRTGKREAEDRFLHSFPFHPDMTDALYSRWTQIEGFQRTRGILRTLATALREAEAWDRSPLVGPSVLPRRTRFHRRRRGGAGTRGRRLDGQRAGEEDRVGAAAGGGAGTRRARSSASAWRFRRRARWNRPSSRSFSTRNPRERRRTRPSCCGWWALGPRPHRIGKGTAPLARDLVVPRRCRCRRRRGHLRRGGGAAQVVALGQTRPNLKQMHDEACRKPRDGRDGGSAAGGARSQDEGAHEWRVGGGGRSPCAAEIAPRGRGRRPSPVRDPRRGRGLGLGQAEQGRGEVPRRDHGAAPPRRVNRNAVVIAVPSREGLEAARAKVRALLGWEDVASQLSGQTVDVVREQRLRRQQTNTRGEVPGVNPAGLRDRGDRGRGQHGPRLQAPRQRKPVVRGDQGTPEDAPHRNAGQRRGPPPRRTLRPVAGGRGIPVRRVVGGRLRPLSAAAQGAPAETRPSTRCWPGVRDGLFVARLKRPDGQLPHLVAGARGGGGLPVTTRSKSSSRRRRSCRDSQSTCSLRGRCPNCGRDGDEGEHGSVLPVDALLDYFAGGHVATIPREGYDDIAPDPRVPLRHGAPRSSSGPLSGAPSGSQTRPPPRGRNPSRRRAQPERDATPTAGTDHAAGAERRDDPSRVGRRRHDRRGPRPGSLTTAAHSPFRGDWFAKPSAAPSTDAGSSSATAASTPTASTTRLETSSSKPPPRRQRHRPQRPLPQLSTRHNSKSWPRRHPNSSGQPKARPSASTSP